MTTITSTTGDRIQVTDLLRGFSPIGIVIAHSAGQYIAGPTPPGYTILFGPADTVADGVDKPVTRRYFLGLALHKPSVQALETTVSVGLGRTGRFPVKP